MAARGAEQLRRSLALGSRLGDVGLMRPVDVDRLGVDRNASAEVVLRVQREDTGRTNNNVVDVGVAITNWDTVEDPPTISQLS